MNILRGRKQMDWANQPFGTISMTEEKLSDSTSLNPISTEQASNQSIKSESLKTQEELTASSLNTHKDKESILPKESISTGNQEQHDAAKLLAIYAALDKTPELRENYVRACMGYPGNKTKSLQKIIPLLPH